MPDLEHVRFLLGIARRDLGDLTAMVEPERVSEETFGLHAQQAIEKALKAWLTIGEIDYPYEHDLRVLCELVDDLEPGEIQPFKHLIPLSLFAVQFRYGVYDDEPLDRAAILEDVRRLVDGVEARMRQAEARQ